MDSEKLNRWLSLGANFGVLIGIVFLAIEIRQNTETTRAQMIQSRAETSVFLAAETFNSEHMPDIWMKVIGGEELSDSEFFRYRTWFRATLRNQDNNIQQYNQGLLGAHIPRAARGLVLFFIVNNQIGQERWEQSKYTYSDDFIEFIDAIIAEEESRD